MPSKTKFKKRDEFRAELREVTEQLLIEYIDPHTVLTKDLVSIEAAGYHFISQLIKPPYTSKTKETLCQLLYHNIYRAELLSEGAGEITFIAAMSFLREYLEKDWSLPGGGVLNKQLETSIEKMRRVIEDVSENVREHELKEAISDICEDPDLSEACWEAVKLAGLEGRVFIENGLQDSYVVELKEGYTFPLKTYPFFLKRGKWESRQCKVLVVDGFIEAVSEIDQLLNEAHDKEQPMALISHGFSEEVVSTLYTNFKRGKLNVIPLRLMSDVNNLNVINDIGCVCGADPVSSLKGQMLTFVKYEELPVVEHMLVSDTNATIENFKSRESVFAQVKALLAKREENRLIGDIQNILDGRIRSLQPNAVILRLPNMDAFKNDAFRIKLDKSLRSSKTMLNYGVIKDRKINRALKWDVILNGHGNMASVVENSFEERFFDIVEDVTYSTKGPGYAAMSALCLYAGLLIGSKLAFMVLSANGAVQRDDS